MKKFLVFIPLLFGCKSVLCPVVESVAISFSETIVQQCQCKNSKQVATDILGVVDNSVVCSAPMGSNGGPVASIVCPIAGSLVTGYLSGKIPSSWECDAASSCVGNVVSVAVAACEVVPL